MELHLKHRPKRLKDVVGQKAAVAILEGWLEDGAVPRAILIHGPSGTGKTTLARILAKRIGAVGSDLQEINAAESRGIDMVRELISSMPLAPMMGKKRMWIIDEAHQLAAATAQQALLKPLEDMPPHAHFVLCTTDPNKLLATIRNRCSAVKCERLKIKEMEGLIRAAAEKEGLSIDEELVDRIVETAEGSARQALSCLGTVAKLPPDERVEAVEKANSREATRSLCQVLLDPRSKWQDVTKVIAGLDEEPEHVRHAVLGYMAGVLKGGGKLAGRAAFIAGEFEAHWYDCRESGLLTTCWKVICEK